MQDCGTRVPSHFTAHCPPLLLSTGATRVIETGAATVPETHLLGPSSFPSASQGEIAMPSISVVLCVVALL